MKNNKRLADEIERRRLNFADLPPGKYEMLSVDEHDVVIAALKAYGTKEVERQMNEQTLHFLMKMMNLMSEREILVHKSFYHASIDEKGFLSSRLIATNKLIEELREKLLGVDLCAELAEGRDTAKVNNTVTNLENKGVEITELAEYSAWKELALHRGEMIKDLVDEIAEINAEKTKKPEPVSFRPTQQSTFVEWHNRGWRNTSSYYEVKFNDGSVFNIQGGWLPK